MEKNKLLFAFVVSAIGISQQTLAQTSQSVEQLVNNAKILPAEFKIRAYVTGPEATIVTYRNAKALDQDCKIDAILIAQTVMAKYKSIAAVRTQFCNINKPSQYDQIEIHAGDVKAFDSGGLTKQRLLESLPISRVGPGNQGATDKTKFMVMLRNYKAVPGFGLDLRQKTLGFMRDIQSYGGDASEYWPAFQATENKIKAGLGQEVIDECNNLHTKVFTAYSAAYAAYIKRQDSNQAQLDAITSRNAFSYDPVKGPMYAERMRLAQKIARLGRSGQDVKWYQAMFINHIEEYARHNDLARLKSGISDLEIRLHLAPM